jgi:dihydrolipoamide dehydrogenase
MPVDVLMPRLGRNVVRGTVTRWLRSVGDHVEEDEPLFEVSTDKVDSEISSPATGTLTEILVPEGMTVTVDTRLAVISDAEEEAEVPVAAGEVAELESTAAAATETAPRVPSGPLMSPPVRLLINQYGLDPREVHGTGEGGRITRHDVLEAAARRQPSGNSAPLAAPTRSALRVGARAEQFDAVVVGAGPSGCAAALYGASAGMRIAVIEEQRVGGACLHRGCIPAKELLRTAEVLRTVTNANEFGIELGQQATLDLAISRARTQQVVDQLTSELEGLLKVRGVTVVPGRASIIDYRTRHVRVSDGSEFRGAALILATGSLPRSLPGLEFDGERILNSDHVLMLDEVPDRVLIIGAGAVGCELASLLSDVGSEVTLVESLRNILPGVDVEAAEVVAESFRGRGVQMYTNARLTGLDGARELRVNFVTPHGAHRVTVDKVVVSIGREPRTELIDVDESGIELDSRGFIDVDDLMRTTAPDVYAVGDVVDSPQLAHVGFAEAMIAIKSILGEEVKPLDYNRVPWSIFCRPELAFSGYTEAHARALGYDVVTSVHRFCGNARAVMIGEPDGLVKIVAERDGPILGVHIAGPRATELLQEGSLAVNRKATAEQVAALIHPHPTLSEVVGASALEFTGRNLYA